MGSACLISLGIIFLSLINFALISILKGGILYVLLFVGLLLRLASIPMILILALKLIASGVADFLGQDWGLSGFWDEMSRKDYLITSALIVLLLSLNWYWSVYGPVPLF